MRFIVLVKGNKDTEAGALPSEQLIAEMTKFNEDLVNAGVLLGGDGLHPTEKGARIRFSGNKRTVIDGPFTESKEIVAGFWLIQTKTRQEAIEWMKRCPNPSGEEGELELRQIFDAEDFAVATSTPPELVQKEKEIFERAKKNAQKSAN